MALTNIHFAVTSLALSPEGEPVPNVGEILWSEEPAAGVATTKTVPNLPNSNGRAVMRVYAPVAGYVAFGPSPNAAVSPRVYMDAGSKDWFEVKAGDKAIWVADV